MSGRNFSLKSTLVLFCGLGFGLTVSRIHSNQLEQKLDDANLELNRLRPEIIGTWAFKTKRYTDRLTFWPDGAFQRVVSGLIDKPDGSFLHDTYTGRYKTDDTGALHVRFETVTDASGIQRTFDAPELEDLDCALRYGLDKEGYLVIVNIAHSVKMSPPSNCFEGTIPSRIYGKGDEFYMPFLGSVDWNRVDESSESG